MSGAVAAQLLPAVDVVTIRDLSVEFAGGQKPVRALRHVDLTVPRGTILGIVGESGSGKSTLAMTIMGLLPNSARIAGGSIRLGARELVGLPERALRDLRGTRMSMIFQDPMTALNPVRSIGSVMLDVQYRDRHLTRAARWQRSIDLLRKVGIPDPERQVNRYPHQFSGGMRQRIAIAMALLGKPELLIADEPTTALDVTLEAQILHLLRGIRAELDGSIVFISHNLGAVAEICDHVAVLYAGEVVERGPVREIFHDPRHPYTRALLDCDPARILVASRQLPSIPGEVPNLARLPAGCVFAGRCGSAMDICRVTPPSARVIAPGRDASCHLVEASG
ncbi:MAG: ABC transporter ATP-binding protein [Dongiaceae bacterium]